MPKGPNGEWRPAETGPCAVHVMKIATGEIEETFEAPQRPDPVADSRRAAKAGKARAASQTTEERSQQGRAAAAARWGAGR